MLLFPPFSCLFLVTCRIFKFTHLVTPFFFIIIFPTCIIVLWSLAHTISTADRLEHKDKANLVILEGEMGCGKEETITWLKRVCANRSLRVIAMKPSVEDRAGEYSTIARLFRLLIREENFDDPVRQKLVVETLLRETYPNDLDTREKVAYPAMCSALGVTCIIRRAFAYNRQSEYSKHGGSGFAQSQQSSSQSLAYLAGQGMAGGQGQDSINGIHNSSKNNLLSSHKISPSKNFIGWIASRQSTVSPGLFGLDTSVRANHNRSPASPGLFGIDSSNNKNRANSTNNNNNNNNSNISEGAIAQRSRSFVVIQPDCTRDQALADILSHLLREQRVVVIIEDAHEVDEQSWSVLLALMEREEAWSSMFVFTHESMEILKSLNDTIFSTSSIAARLPEHNVGSLDNMNSDTEPILSSKPMLERFPLQRFPSVLPTYAMKTALAKLTNTMHDGTFVRLSLVTTMNNLKSLKEKCQGNSEDNYCMILNLTYVEVLEQLR